MTTQLMPNSMSLPPPVELALHDGDHHVGWVSDGALGFRGFADETEAVSAAWMAHRTVSQQLARRDGQRPVPIDVEPLAIVRRGDDEMILASARPIGRLLRPAADSRSGPDSFGFEVPLPLADELDLRSAAHLIYRTLRRSGIRWALWRREANPRGPVSSYRNLQQRYGFEGLARAGRRAPVGGVSATAFVTRSIVIATAITLVIALLLTAPRAVSLPIALVIGSGLIASGLAAMVARWRGPGRRAFR